MVKDAKKRTLKIYAAGGGGVNIAQNILNIPKGAAGFPEYEITRIDTSMSNIDTKNTELGNYFFIPGVEGAGKDRKFGYDIIAPHIDKILIDNKPADFNIVIFGLAGGELMAA